MVEKYAKHALKVQHVAMRPLPLATRPVSVASLVQQCCMPQQRWLPLYCVCALH